MAHEERLKAAAQAFAAGEAFKATEDWKKRQKAREPETPEAAAAMVRAAINAEPFARDCKGAAAIAAVPYEEAAIRGAASEFVAMASLQSTGPGTINPMNFSGEGNVNSPEQPPAGP